MANTPLICFGLVLLLFWEKELLCKTGLETALSQPLECCDHRHKLFARLKELSSFAAGNQIYLFTFRPGLVQYLFAFQHLTPSCSHYPHLFCPALVTWIWWWWLRMWRDSFSFPPCGLQGSNSGHQDWCKGLYPLSHLAGLCIFN